MEALLSDAEYDRFTHWIISGYERHGHWRWAYGLAFRPAGPCKE